MQTNCWGARRLTFWKEVLLSAVENIFCDKTLKTIKYMHNFFVFIICIIKYKNVELCLNLLFIHIYLKNNIKKQLSESSLLFTNLEHFVFEEIRLYIYFLKMNSSKYRECFIKIFLRILDKKYLNKNKLFNLFSRTSLLLNYEDKP